MSVSKISYKKFCLFLTTFLVVTVSSLNANNEPVKKYHLLSGSSFVQSKNYYLLTLFEELADVKKLLSVNYVCMSAGSPMSDLKESESEAPMELDELFCGIFYKQCALTGAKNKREISVYTVALSVGSV